MILFEGRDVEEAHHVVSTHFAPHRLRVLEDSELNGRFVAMHTGPVSAFTLGYGATVEVCPGELPDIYNVHVPLTGCGSLHVDAKQVRTACSVVGPGQRLSMRWSADSDTLVLRISRVAMDEALGKRLGQIPALAVRFDPELTDSLGQAWLSAARAFGDGAAAGLFARSPLAAAHFEQVLIHGLLDSQPHDLSDELTERAGADTRTSLRRAMNFCEENAGEPISIADMAVAARTGVRSLQRTFRTHLEMTPLEYLRRIRLERAHLDLVEIAEGRAEGTVSEVAVRWGFVHLGRFSGRYRKVYGRLPGQTLRGGRQSAAGVS